MSAPCFGWAIQQGRERKLPSSERFVLAVLSNRANGSLVCWPSLPMIAADTGLSPRTVYAAVHALESKGLIEIKQRGRSMEYRIMRDADDAQLSQPLQGSNSQLSQPLQGSAPKPSQSVGGDSRKIAHPTLATIASKTTKYESTKTKSVGFNSNLSKEAGTPPLEPEREPTPREVEARRREEAAAIAGMPEGIARAVQSLGAAMRGIAYAPGRSGISRDEQLATYEPRRPKAAPVSDEQLRAIRLLAARSMGRSPLAPGLSLISR